MATWETKIRVNDADQRLVYVRGSRRCHNGDCRYEFETQMEEDEAAFKARVIERFKAEHLAEKELEEAKGELIDDLATEISDALNEWESAE